MRFSQTADGLSVSLLACVCDITQCKHCKSNRIYWNILSIHNPYWPSSVYERNFHTDTIFMNMNNINVYITFLFVVSWSYLPNTNLFDRNIIEIFKMHGQALNLNSNIDTMYKILIHVVWNWHYMYHKISPGHEQNEPQHLYIYRKVLTLWGGHVWCRYIINYKPQNVCLYRKYHTVHYINVTAIY